MTTVVSLLVMLAVAGVLIALSRQAAPRRRANTARGSVKAERRGYTTMGYAFSFTFGAALFLVSGLTGYRLDKREPFFADARWSDDVLWSQIWMGLPFACLAVYFWHKGLREIRSNVYIPDLAGRDASAPPSRRIERR
jgi:hypothetical protein